MVAEVFEAWCVAVSEGPAQCEHDFGCSGGVGGHGVGFDAGLVRNQAVEGVEAVSLGAGDQGLVERRVGVGHPRVEGGAALSSEVARVVSGVNRRDRDDESHPVGRGHVTAAPHAGEGLLGVEVEQECRCS